MSKHETPMVEWYWERVGGLLVEEYPVVPRASSHGLRRLDGLIIRDAPRERVYGELLDRELVIGRALSVEMRARLRR